MNLVGPSIGQIGGLKVFVVETWARGYAWRTLRPGKCPTKRQGRKGTRKAWKRRHPKGLRWRHGPVEPDHAMRSGDAIYCTARQRATIERAMGISA